MNPPLADAVLRELARAFEPLTSIADADALLRLLVAIGLDPQDAFHVDVPDGLTDRVADLVAQAEALARATDDNQRHRAGADTVTALVRVLPLVAALGERVAAAVQAGGGVDLPDAATVARRLVDLLISDYLAAWHPRVYAPLHLLGLVEAPLDWRGRAIKIVRWERLPLLVTDPARLAELAYRWKSGLDGHEVLRRLATLLAAYGLPGGRYVQDDARRAAFGNYLPDELRVPLVRAGTWPESYAEFGVNLAPAVTASGLRGLGAYPIVLGSIDLKEALSDTLTFEVSGTLTLDSGFGLLVFPPDRLVVQSPFGEDGSPGVQLGADARIEVRLRAADRVPTVIFGSAQATRMAFDALGASFVAAMHGGAPEIAVGVELSGLTIVIDTAKDGDAFIQKILSGVKVEAQTDLAVQVSNTEGLTFRGSGALDLTVPLHADLGPFTLDTLWLGVGIADGLTLRVAASLGVVLGPIAGRVERIGLEIPVSVRADGKGNLGYLDLRAPQFLAPTGAGFAIDAGPVGGGGYLEFDTDHARYAGILALTLGDIALTAIGLITTRLPDGQPGVSMLVNIGVIFDPAIELSMGFTLSGVGGLIGINRQMVTQALQAGIRAGTLDSILFPDPKTVIQHADRIISDLRTVFPPCDGQFVVGPMVRIGYGNPNIVTAEVGLFLSLPDPVSLALMGQVNAALPDPEAPIVDINMDILGIVDLGQQMLSFQSSIRNSRILTFALQGDVALLLTWGDKPEFAMSFGGFHPKFAPPPPAFLFSGLRRMGLVMNAGAGFHLQCDTYLALTPNSLQFGAELHVVAMAAGAALDGRLAFDALFIFRPFSFAVDVEGAASISFQGAHLVDVHVDFHLSGPSPWNARGHAVIRVLFIDVSVAFNVTWGQPVPVVPTSTDPLAKVLAAFEDPHNWATLLPSDGGMVEMLHPRVTSDPQVRAVHPAGRLEIRQRVLPLDTQVAKLGEAAVEGHDRIRIAGLSLGQGAGGDVTAGLEVLEDFFARGQFETLSAQQKLSVPAFERMPAGVRTPGSSAIRLADGWVTRKEEVEVVTLDAEREAGPRTSGAARPFAETARRSRAAARARGATRSFAGDAAACVRLRDERFVLVHASTLVRLADYAEMTRMEADHALAALLSDRPGVQGYVIVVAAYEAEEAA